MAASFTKICKSTKKDFLWWLQKIGYHRTKNFDWFEFQYCGKYTNDAFAIKTQPDQIDCFKQ